MNGGLQQLARVMESVVRPYVSDEAWQSMDEANPFDQQEYREWFDQTHEEEYYND